MDKLPDWIIQRKNNIWSLTKSIFTILMMIKTVARFGISLAKVASVRNAKFSSLSGFRLRSLTSLQLCQLFEHCHLYNLGGFVYQNKLTGIHLEDGIENIRDLTDLGLDRLNAKVLLKRIDAWKVEGVPTDFSSTNSTSHFRSGNSSAVTISTTSNDCADAALVQKQLDDDFSAANYCCDRAATDRITAAAEAGDPLAQAYLSILHDKEENLVEKDRTRAVEYATRSLLWLKENASSGNAFALYNLAMCYADGRGVSENEKEAVRYARLAADQNHAGAQNFLGFCFDTGKGVIIDHYEAVRYFKLAADQGRSVGQYNLGLSYSEGKGVTRDEKEAARYFKLAADQGDSWAQYQLGLCYENGAGVTINKQEALRYYKLAADNEHKSAQLRLQNLSHDATAISDSKYVMTNG